MSASALWSARRKAGVIDLAGLRSHWANRESLRATPESKNNSNSFEFEETRTTGFRAFDVIAALASPCGL